MIRGEDGTIHICETELLALAAKLYDPSSARELSGCSDPTAPGGFGEGNVHALTDEEYENWPVTGTLAEAGYGRFGIAFIHPHHMPMVKRLRLVLRGENA